MDLSAYLYCFIIISLRDSGTRLLARVGKQKRANRSFALFKRANHSFFSFGKEQRERFALVTRFKRAARAKERRANSQP